MMKFIIIISILGILFLFPPHIFANQWYYPMDRIEQRQTVKGFGTFINDQFYKDREQLFPYNRFYGYHAGIDFEILADELNKLVPVYALTDGTITYIGNLSGYGGVIIEELENTNHATLYGHVKIKNLSYKTKDHINAGQILTYLGDAFSDETSKERKHLHFAIHKGVDLYFHGHETSTEILNLKWEDPIQYLKSGGAISPAPQISSPTPSATASKTTLTQPTFLETILTTLKTFFKALLQTLSNSKILKS